MITWNVRQSIRIERYKLTNACTVGASETCFYVQYSEVSTQGLLMYKELVSSHIALMSTKEGSTVDINSVSTRGCLHGL